KAVAKDTGIIISLWAWKFKTDNAVSATFPNPIDTIARLKVRISINWNRELAIPTITKGIEYVRISLYISLREIFTVPLSFFNKSFKWGLLLNKYQNKTANPPKPPIKAANVA